MISDLVTWLRDPIHWSGSTGIPTRLVEHLGYSLSALVIAALIGIPLGLYIGHTGRGTYVVAGVANAFRAIPSLGLVLVVVLLITAISPTNQAIVASCVFVLVVLAIPPILTSTYAGVQSVDAAARDAAYGVGMTGREVLFGVEIPCAMPLIFSGVRSAMLQVIATATIAAYTTLGGLGRFLIDGYAVRSFAEMLAGALLVAALALVAEGVLATVQRLVVSAGLSTRRS